MKLAHQRTWQQFLGLKIRWRTTAKSGRPASSDLSEYMRNQRPTDKRDICLPLWPLLLFYQILYAPRENLKHTLSNALSETLTFIQLNVYIAIAMNTPCLSSLTSVSRAGTRLKIRATSPLFLGEFLGWCIDWLIGIHTCSPTEGHVSIGKRWCWSRAMVHGCMKTAAIKHHNTKRKPGGHT